LTRVEIINAWQRISTPAFFCVGVRREYVGDGVSQKSRLAILESRQKSRSAERIEIGQSDVLRADDVG